MPHIRTRVKIKRCKRPVRACLNEDCTSVRLRIKPQWIKTRLLKTHETNNPRGSEMSHKQSKKIRKLLNYRHGDTATELKHHHSMGRLGWTEAITTPLRKLYQQMKRK